MLVPVGRVSKARSLRQRRILVHYVGLPPRAFRERTRVSSCRADRAQTAAALFEILDFSRIPLLANVALRTQIAIQA